MKHSALVAGFLLALAMVESPCFTQQVSGVTQITLSGDAICRGTIRKV